jgi:hypothetical protein
MRRRSIELAYSTHPVGTLSAGTQRPVSATRQQVALVRNGLDDDLTRQESLQRALEAHRSLELARAGSA